MPARTRKLIGTIALLILLAIYVPAAVSIGASHFVAASSLAQLAYFLAPGCSGSYRRRSSSDGCSGLTDGTAKAIGVGNAISVARPKRR
jgi:hypothetical protein